MCSSRAKHQPSLSEFHIFTISKLQTMKKTYISPEFVAIELRCRRMIAQSMTMSRGSGNQIDNIEDVLVRENNPTTSGNLWSDEW